MTTKTRAVFWRKDDQQGQAEAAEVMASGVAGGAVLTELNSQHMRERVAHLVSVIGADVEYLPNDSPEARQENAKRCAREALCLYAATMLVGVDAQQMLEMIGLDEHTSYSVLEKLKLIDDDDSEFPCTPAFAKMRAATIGPRHNQ